MKQNIMKPSEMKQNVKSNNIKKPSSSLIRRCAESGWRLLMNMNNVRESFTDNHFLWQQDNMTWYDNVNERVKDLLAYLLACLLACMHACYLFFFFWLKIPCLQQIHTRPWCFQCCVVLDRHVHSPPISHPLCFRPIRRCGEYRQGRQAVDRQKPSANPNIHPRQIAYCARHFLCR